MKTNSNFLRNYRKVLITGALAIMLLLISTIIYAQDANAGINEATNMVKSYFQTGTNLMYAIGAVSGLVGAIKVYQKWNGGDHDTGKVAAAWFGSCIFVVVGATVLQSFFWNLRWQVFITSTRELTGRLNSRG